MSKYAAAVSLPEWQVFSAKDPAGAAREITRRIQTQLSDSQQRAVYAWIQTERDLTMTFERFAGTLAPFAGVPYALKDIFPVANLTIRAGGRLPPGTFPKKERDGKFAHVLRGLGAVLTVKTHLHEFAAGLTGENPHYGDCEHPHYPERTTGGSSSGSAAVVAAGILPLGIGSDTAGSIRVPAAFCGLYGLRTTPHHPWIEDALPLAPSFDTAGWFTGNAADMLTTHRFLLGVTKSDQEPRGCFLDFDALGLPADPEVAQAVRHAAEKLANPADKMLAGQFRDGFAHATETYLTIQSTEAAKTHAAWLDPHKALYSQPVWQRIDRGRHVTPAQLDEAQTRLAAIRELWSGYFLQHDFLVMPVAPFPALRKEDCTITNRERLLALNTPASLGGLPVLTIPVSLPSGLTTGLQIIVNSPQSHVIPWVLKRP